MATKKIEDFGEKIGGARKDRSSGRKPRTKSTAPKKSALPVWERDFIVAESMRSDGYTRQEAGKWYIHERPKKNSRFLGRPLNKTGFATEAEARKYLPIAAVSKKHSVTPVDATGKMTYKDPVGYEIWRKVSDTKRVKVVGESFASADEASRYLAQNAKAIIEVRTNFGEEILAKPKLVKGMAPRTGPKRRPGDITPKALHEAFGMRGVEFGNWNSQPERQAVMNSAYDALRDLNKATGLPPKAIGLKGELGLAFGARGHGLSGAKAHYERDFGAINLTKMKGAGSLGHEWWHALDHMLGREDAGVTNRTAMREGHAVFDASGRETDYASHRVYGRKQGKLPEGVRKAHKELIDAMFYRQEVVPSDAEGPKRFVEAQRKNLQERLDGIRKHLAEELRYGKRFTKPATPAQLARFDKLAGELMASDPKVEWRSVEGKKRYGNYRWTNDTIEEMSKLFKEVRGSSGFIGSRTGALDYVASNVANLRRRLDILNDAASSSTAVRNIPTDFSMNARRIDQGRVGDYWQTRHEMSARAFSAFLEDKLAARGNNSTFLAYGSDNRRLEYRIINAKPFPEGAERAAINAKFETLFSELRSSGMLGKFDAPRKGLSKMPAGWSDAAREASAMARGAALPGEAKPTKPKRAPKAKKTGVETLNLELKDRGVIGYTVRHDSPGDPFRYKTTKHINVGYGDDGYPIAKIVHARTKKEFMAQIRAAEKAIAAGPKTAATSAAAATKPAAPKLKNPTPKQLLAAVPKGERAGYVAKLAKAAKTTGSKALAWLAPAVGVGVGVYALTRGATPAQAAYEGADAFAGGALSDYGQHRKQGATRTEAAIGATAQYATMGMISAEHFAKTADVRKATQAARRSREARRQAMSQSATKSNGVTDAHYRAVKTSRGTRRVKVSAYRTPAP